MHLLNSTLVPGPESFSISATDTEGLDSEGGLPLGEIMVSGPSNLHKPLAILDVVTPDYKDY